ncbi:MAG: sodium dependent phosphate transporter [Acidobacteria bacterium]|nr:MAG: sodium dependent phosphate transporter [Acidobacteriota bacterium]
MSPPETLYNASPIVDSPKRSIPTVARAALVVGLLYLFLVGIKLLESGVKGLGSDTAGGLFEGITNPLAALFVGILATVLVQSSSVTTATIVGLVATGVLPIEVAVPMIMGANIGTSVTNTIVSLAHARKTEEFRLAFSAATMHDFFNLIAVAILLPLELATGFLQSTAAWLAELLPGGSDATFDSPIKGAVKWGASLVQQVIERIVDPGTALGVTFIVVGISIIFFSLAFVTKNMRVLIAARLERSVNAALARSGLVGIAVGIIITVAVQSSSITTSILVPIVASGILLVRNAYPITLGANIGTTVTAIIAALATGAVSGMTIALVHVLFNVTAILILYPWTKIRYVPVTLAEKLAGVAVQRRWVAVAYTVIVFIVIPLAGIVILT